MSTVTDGVTIIVPTLVLGYESTRAGRSVLVEPIDSPAPYVSFAEGQTRSGRIEYLFADEAASKAAEDLHRTGHILTLDTGGERPSIDMSYVVAGAIDRELEPQTRAAWILRVEWREVPA